MRKRSAIITCDGRWLIFLDKYEGSGQVGLRCCVLTSGRKISCQPPGLSTTLVFSIELQCTYCVITWSRSSRTVIFVHESECF